MREAFITKRFQVDSLTLISTINGILDNYEAQGYDLSLRQLYYQLVARNLIENTEKSYKNIGNLVSDGRLAGLIDWNMIRDRGRTTSHSSHCESVTDVVRSSICGFKVDMWARQENYVEVMVEKQALEGVLEPVCCDLDIPFSSNKGYSSSSAMYDASKRFVAAAEAGKNLHVLYLGDHDPSGIDMTRDVDDRFNLFISTTMGWRNSSDDERGHEVHRLALNMDQVRKFKCPKNPAKMTDLRAAGYVRKFGRSSWELDAVEPSTLAKLVKDAVKDLIDQDIWDEDLAKEAKGRKELKGLADDYDNPLPPHICPKPKTRIKKVFVPSWKPELKRPDYEI